VRVTVEFDVPTRMRDGTILRANVYRPSADGPWPTLLARSPYGKDHVEIVDRLDPVQAARRGLMVVVQDTRGRFASDGDWDPFVFERPDGYDSVVWAATLPGSNGRIGMYGDSYLGNAQWMAAAERPSSLAAISPALTWSDPMDGLLSRGGAVELGLGIPWTIQTGLGHLLKLPISTSERDRRVVELIDDYDHLADRGYWDLPVCDMAVLRRHRLPDLGSIRVLVDPSIADRSRVTGLYDRVAVPTYHTAGWHDTFLQGTLDNYVAMAERGNDSQLVVGPWTHSTFSDPIGHLLFGLKAGRFGVSTSEQADQFSSQLAWFSERLVPDSKPRQVDTPVRIFTMGRNVWRQEKAWPLARAKAERWFLAAGNLLTRDAPDIGGGTTEYEYDPAHPVPTVGGPFVVSPPGQPGPLDQSVVEARKDVCIFTSAVLQLPLEVTGRVRCFLHAQSSAPSTDWVVRLCDVHPDGRSYNVCDGILRVLEGADRDSVCEVDLWSTSIVFLTGHRLRIQVTSSCFPRWDRNLNTGNQRASSYQLAHQRIFHDAIRASYLELPVIGQGDG
jgi:uncharacterized protein